MSTLYFLRKTYTRPDRWMDIRRDLLNLILYLHSACAYNVILTNGKAVAYVCLVPHARPAAPSYADPDIQCMNQADGWAAWQWKYCIHAQASMQDEQTRIRHAKAYQTFGRATVCRGDKCSTCNGAYSQMTSGIHNNYVVVRSKIAAAATNA